VAAESFATQLKHQISNLADDRLFGLNAARYQDFQLSIRGAPMAKKNNESYKAGAAAAAGGAAGYAATTASGMTAIGVIGKGAGMGAAAGPVGAAAGALIGLAGYGLYRLFTDD
jgi:hypothetical protein